jgi:hypothetical protein
MRDIDVVVHFGLRYEAVESILEGWPQNPDERSSRRATVGIEYGNLIGAGNWRWTIAKCEDVPVVCKEVADSIEKAGFQFFARLSTLEELMEVLITEGQRPTYCLDSTRATAIPVVAALLGRTDKLGEYCRYWWGRLQQNPNFPFHARAYPSFVEYLSHRFGVPIQID